jgi:hypothetical protein
MRDPEGLGLGGRMMALGAAGVVLSFGLCGAGGAAQSHHMSPGRGLFMLGILSLGLGLLFLVIGFVAFLAGR